MNSQDSSLLQQLPPEKRELVLEALRREALREQKPPIARRKFETDRIPLSFAQHRLWLLDQTQAGGYAYNEVCVLRLSGILDERALTQSLNEIVRRHETLRTTFPTVNGTPVQRVAPWHPHKLAVVHLGPNNDGEQEAELQRLIRQEVQHAFDLTHGPLLRMTLVQLGQKDHALILSTHHIIMDGWSIGVFKEELATHYRAFSRGESRPPLGELPVQYGDFAVWQRECVGDADFSAQLAYWTAQLKDLPPVLHLPVAKQRPERDTLAGARRHFTLSPHLSEQLRELSRQQGVTLFMTLLASFQVLLYRYTARTDIPVATAVANRHQAEIEKLIGFFVNTLVLRGHLGGNPTFVELLKRVRESALDAYEHQELPFEQLVSALRPERSLSYQPLFQVGFDLQNAPRALAELPGLTLTVMDVEGFAAKYDLSLWMEDHPQGLKGIWEYKTALFEPGAIESMTGHFTTLLESVLQNHDLGLSEHQLLTPLERERIARESAAPRPQLPQRCVHELVESQAARTPDALALAYANRQVRYSELNEQANRLGRHLGTLDVGGECVVGICVEDACELLVAMLAVLKTGAAYVLLDPSDSHRTAAVTVDVKPSLILTQRHLLPQLAQSTARMVCVDSYRESDWTHGVQLPYSKYDSRDLGRSVKAEDVSCLYNAADPSDLTKAIVLTHRNLTHSALARRHTEETSACRCLLLSHRLSGGWASNAWSVLVRGGCVVLPRDLDSDASEIVRLISGSDVSSLVCSPSLYSEVLRTATPGQLDTLKVVVLTGGWCSKSLLQRHRDSVAHAKLTVEYGPAETSFTSALHQCEETDVTRARVPLGESTGNSQKYVLDCNLQPAPIGVPGELFVAGDGVARGYLNRAKATAETFIQHPPAFATAPLCKTGDRARYLADGSIEVLGKQAEHVTIRGFDVELRDIEEVLHLAPGVCDVAVIAFGQADARKHLVAYVVVSSVETSESSLKEFARQSLPGLAVPTEVLIVAAIVRRRDGSVDVARLPAPLRLNDAADAPSRSEWSAVESGIAVLWRETLNVPSVGLDDNFFDIGGDSLTIVRVFNRLKEVTDKDVPITSLFKYQTLRALAAFLEG